MVRGALITHQGQVTWPPPKPEAPPAQETKPAPAPEPEVKKEEAAPVEEKKSGGGLSWLFGLALAGAWLGLHFTSVGEQSAATKDFLQHLTVFVLACFVGWQVVWSVTAALHTPLMSVTNAISGIIVVGGLLQASGAVTDAATILGIAAIFFATINIAGGFLVTKRMLAMFHK